MKIWLTIAEAPRYSDARQERVGTPAHVGGFATQRSGRPPTGRLRGYDDGC
jgi:hypothetical protein